MNKFVIVLLVRTVTSTCDDDNSTFDSGGDPCSWYDSNQHACGNYDDLDFTASTQCCACDGGDKDEGNPYLQSIDLKTQSLCDQQKEPIWWNYGILDQGLEFHKEECFSTCESKAESYMESNQCTNDISVVDSSGRNCEWYQSFPEACGFFNTYGEKCESYGVGQCFGDFKAEDACCVCKNSVEKFCCNFVELSNSQGSSCDLVVDSNTFEQDSDFSAVAYVFQIYGDGYVDTLATDSHGDGCSWYTQNPSGCGNFDDSDFTAAENCCACGGGAKDDSDGYGNCQDYNSVLVPKSSFVPIDTFDWGLFWYWFGVPLFLGYMGCVIGVIGVIGLWVLVEDWAVFWSFLWVSLPFGLGSLIALFAFLWAFSDVFVG